MNSYISYIKLMEYKLQMTQSSQDITSNWYKKYYETKGANRNDILTNPGVLLQTLATEKSVIEALRSLKITNRQNTKILDVGCGTGMSLIPFLRCGFEVNNFYGIDIQQDRIDEAKKLFPNSHFVCGDAANSKYQTEFFDIAFESTMFMQLTNQDIREGIACEMCRVMKKSGAIVLSDWSYASPFSSNYRALTKSDIKRLFHPRGWRISTAYPGALIPPIGRFISSYFPSLYFNFAKIPYFAALKTWVIRFESDDKIQT